MPTQDNSYDTPNQMQQGGSLWSIGVGGQLDISGGVLSRNGVNETRSLSITPAPGTPASNICLVSIQLLDALGNAVSNQECIDVWLSDAATGAGLTGTSASGAVAAGASGTDLLVRTAKKETLSQTTTAGLYILSITDTAKTGFYVAVLRGSSLVVSAQLVTASYG